MRLDSLQTAAIRRGVMVVSDNGDSGLTEGDSIGLCGIPSFPREHPSHVAMQRAWTRCVAPARASDQIW